MGAFSFIEAASFSTPWSRDAFEKEVTENACARYLVLKEDGVPVAMSEKYEAQLRSVDFEKLYEARLRNVRRLRERIEPLRRDGLLRFLTGTPEESTLYFPIRLENRDAVQKAMAAKNVYCPVIWPEPVEAAGVCPVSRAVVDDMLAIPCDQRYDEADMDYISGCLTEILRGC